MEGEVIKYTSGNGTLSKGVVKSHRFQSFIVLRPDGHAEVVWEPQVIKRFTPPPTTDFEKWLNENYKYNQKTDEYIRASRKFTKCALYHTFLFQKFN